MGEQEFMEHGINGWEGLFVGGISVKMPKGLTGDDDKRLEVYGQNMLFDASGVTLEAGLKNLLKAKAGNFALSLDKVELKFVQSNFNRCEMAGSMTVPLIKNEEKEAAQIGFTCQIRKQIDDKSKKETDDWAYVFNTQSLNQGSA